MCMVLARCVCAAFIQCVYVFVLFVCGLLLILLLPVYVYLYDVRVRVCARCLYWVLRLFLIVYNCVCPLVVGVLLYCVCTFAYGLCTRVYYLCIFVYVYWMVDVWCLY